MVHSLLLTLSNFLPHLLPSLGFLLPPPSPLSHPHPSSPSFLPPFSLPPISHPLLGFIPPSYPPLAFFPLLPLSHPPLPFFFHPPSILQPSFSFHFPPPIAFSLPPPPQKKNPLLAFIPPLPPLTWLRDSNVKYIEEQAVERGRYCLDTVSTSAITTSVSSTFFCTSAASFFRFSS